MSIEQIGKTCLQCGGKLDVEGYFYCKKDLIEMTKIDTYDDLGSRSSKRQLKSELIRKKILENDSSV